MNYIFGPVPSRRLGISLGIDLLPYKTCSLDCIYCECGKTTDLRVERGSFFPVDEIISELKQVLSNNPELDYITFSGSGEPLLYLEIDKIINFIKSSYPQYKVAILTNATPLIDENIWPLISGADLIVPSIDSVIEEQFNKINRPHQEVKLDEMLSKIKEFRKQFPGEFRVEVFIIPGLNDNKIAIESLKKYLLELNPDLVQLNRLDRPGTDRDTKRAEDQLMIEINKSLLPLPVESIGNYIGKSSPLFEGDFKAAIINLLEVRPVELFDLIKITGRSRVDVLKVIVEIGKDNNLDKYEQQGKTYYRLRN